MCGPQHAEWDGRSVVRWALSLRSHGLEGSIIVWFMFVCVMCSIWVYKLFLLSLFVFVACVSLCHCLYVCCIYCCYLFFWYYIDKLFAILGLLLFVSLVCCCLFFLVCCCLFFRLFFVCTVDFYCVWLLFHNP